MSIFTPKKLILFGLAAILLIAIPLTVYLVQKQQEIKSRAAPSTTLSFQPLTATVSKGQDVSFDVMMDPGSNFVSFVHLVIDYDTTKLTKSGDGFVINTTVFPGFDPSKPPVPTYDPAGKITVDLAVGSNPTASIQKQTKIGTLTLKATAITDPGTPTKITFDSQTQVLTSQGDQFNTNVLSTTNPASVTITEAETLTPTPTQGITPTLSPAPTETPQVSPTPTTTPGPGGPVNQSPTCTALSLDRETSGTAPYSITLTASGSDSDGTINKVAFSFGDGAVQDMTEGGGIGTSTVSAQISHTYNNAGTFSATAALTDDSGGVSSATTCTQTITVNAAQPSPPPVVTTPTPTMAPGPSDVIIGIGVFGIILAIIGGFLLFAL
ncbi:MAG: hypothetical protein A3B44_00930 [Candidatus Levybacteria bacterium RIFCSPLOWO2_01_FULL_38_21]|nr:MAG: hypothetical protein A3B44_00930 [Candidatus Levybacteria bacterium RIFCSPLOWO2_01_FULL_38_21]